MTDVTPTPYSLNKFKVTRPEKITWIFPAGLPPLDQIKNHGLKKFLAKAEEHLHENHINWSLEPLTDEGFLHWLSYYRTKMFETGLEIIADEVWYNQKIASGHKVLGLLFYQDGNLVASGIICQDPKTQTAELVFKASHKIELSNRGNSTIAAVVDFFFLRWAFDQKMTLVIGGKSQNAFGVYDSLGYLDFALKLGYQPEAISSNGLLTDVPTLPEKPVIFYGLQDKSLKLFSHSEVLSDPSLSHFINQGFELVTVT